MLDILLAWVVIKDIESGRNTGKLTGYVIMGLIVAVLFTVVIISF